MPIEKPFFLNSETYIWCGKTKDINSKMHTLIVKKKESLPALKGSFVPSFCPPAVAAWDLQSREESLCDGRGAGPTHQSKRWDGGDGDGDPQVESSTQGEDYISRYRIFECCICIGSSNVCLWLWVAGSGAAAQHNPADVWRKGWRGRRAQIGPWRCEEHVQNPDWWTAEEPEINSFFFCHFWDTHSQTNRPS